MKRSAAAATLGAVDYHEGSLLRLSDAEHLYQAKQWVGCIYLAGRAAEATLRSLLWIKTRQQEEGHDLAGLLKRVKRLIPFHPSDEERLQDATNEVGVVWRNDGAPYLWQHSRKS